MTSAKELLLLATQINTLVEDFVKIFSAKESEIKALNERIADLEEANASRGKTRPITKEQWAENFK